jgi:hypothetical protein
LIPVSAYSSFDTGRCGEIQFVRADRGCHRRSLTFRNTLAPHLGPFRGVCLRVGRSAAQAYVRSPSTLRRAVGRTSASLGRLRSAHPGCTSVLATTVLPAYSTAKVQGAALEPDAPQCLGSFGLAASTVSAVLPVY